MSSAMNSKKSAKEHPPYLKMIKEAISALKERSGSSQPAIAKFLEDKYKKQLPPNFRKLLSVQLRRFAKSEKLFKVKNSYKITKPADAAAPATAGHPKKKVLPAASAKAKAAAPKKKEATVVGKKAVKKPAAGVKKPVKAKIAKKPVKPAGEKNKDVKKPAAKTKSLKAIKSPKAPKPATKKRVAAKSIKSAVKPAAKKPRVTKK